jgi:hypothetical protein
LDESIETHDVFIRLIFGLHTYLQDTSIVPFNLRLGLNALAFESPETIPKTLYHFVRLAHTPVRDWYPLPIPDGFNPSQSLLYEHRLSEEAQDFHLDMMERLQLPPTLETDIPQSVLDNTKMLDLRQRLKAMPDAHEAQALYEQLRLFLITHSWTTPEQLKALSRDVFMEVKVFYVEMLEPSGLYECDRCGLLVWHDNRLEGIKPSYCSDHGSDSPHVKSIPNQLQLYRLREGIHLRTFIPGRIELALFDFVEKMETNYPDEFTAVERYPGIDTYDLRLVFRDGEVWAVDAKDQAYPKRLARQIQLPYGEGDLAYTRAFFVIPDARMEEDGYADELEHAIGSCPKNLEVIVLSIFMQRVEEKLKSLAKPTRFKKG